MLLSTKTFFHFSKPIKNLRMEGLFITIVSDRFYLLFVKVFNMLMGPSLISNNNSV